MTHFFKISQTVVMLGAISCFWSCTKAKDEDIPGSSSAGGTMSTIALPNQLNIKSESLGLIQNAKLLGNPAPQATLQALKSLDSAGTFGHSLADGIKALKFRISGMTLCGETDGSKGDACNSRPFSLYNEGGAGDYDSFVPGSEAVANFTNWTDFMKKARLKSWLAQSPILILILVPTIL